VGDFVSAMKGQLGTQKAKQGSGIRFLTETLTSPLAAEQISLIQQVYPQAKWHRWEPAGKTATDASPVYDFTKADVIVTLDADFLGGGPASLKYSARLRRTPPSRRRRGRGRGGRAGHEPPLRDREHADADGAKADHRLALKASEIAAAAQGLSGSGAAQYSNGAAPASSRAAAKDLQAHRGRSLVVAGDYQPAAVHALARQLNESLGNVGQTVTYGPEIELNPVDHAASIRELAQAMDAGQVELLIILGGNPVFTAPADLKFEEALKKVGTTVSLSMFPDETAFVTQWNIPEAHALESWGDARAFDGTVTVMQPLIAPLYDGKTVHDVLAVFIDAQSGKSTHDLVKDYWTRASAGAVGGWAITDPTGAPFKSADSMWKHVLHDGWVSGTGRGGSRVPARRLCRCR
jgi:molybdopterin-containing oxidoreductase family iron-sulfur binding subunit